MSPLNIMSIFVGACAIWVYLDASGNKVGQRPRGAGWGNQPAGAWGAGTLLLWIIVFPLYLLRRRGLVDEAKHEPVESSNRGLKAGFLGALVGVWVWVTHPGPVDVPVPECDSVGVRDTLARIIDDMPEVRAAGGRFVSIKAIGELHRRNEGTSRSCLGTLVTNLGEHQLSYSLVRTDAATGEYYAEVEIRPVTPSAIAPKLDARALMAKELARFAEAKGKLRTTSPKTETAIVALLGEPSSTMETPSTKMLHWYFETKEVGRDVIAVNVDPAGKLSFLQY